MNTARSALRELPNRPLVVVLAILLAAGWSLWACQKGGSEDGSGSGSGASAQTEASTPADDDEGSGQAEQDDEETADPQDVVAENGVVDSQAACGVEDLARASIEGRLNRNTVDFEVPGGLTVILKQTPGNPVVAVRLFIDGGSRLTDASTAGIAELALNVATNGGTESLSKQELSAQLAAMGSSIGFSSDFDYNVVSMGSLTAFVDETWALYRDVLTAPAFPEAEIALAREHQLQSINSRADDPDNQVVDVARALLFTGHPYLNRPLGTAEAVSSLTRDQLIGFYQGLLDNPNRVLVVVGDLTQEQVTALIGDTFAAGTSGEAPPAVPAFTVDGVALDVAAETIPTNYILGLAPAPPPGHDDYPALELASRHLRDRLFEEVRTRRNLTYAVSSSLSGRLANYSTLYVTAVDPAATLPVMFAEVERLRTTPLTEKQLTDLISVFVTSYYTGLDSNGVMAGRLAWWHQLGGGRENADRYIEQLSQVTAEDIQRVANTYLSNYQFGVVGNPELVTLELVGGSQN